MQRRAEGNCVGSAEVVDRGNGKFRVELCLHFLELFVLFKKFVRNGFGDALLGDFDMLDLTCAARDFASELRDATRKTIKEHKNLLFCLFVHMTKRLFLIFRKSPRKSNSR